jgi:hypothetical protein
LADRLVGDALQKWLADKDERRHIKIRGSSREQRERSESVAMLGNRAHIRGGKRYTNGNLRDLRDAVL